jgi:hypothetical protein
LSCLTCLYSNPTRLSIKLESTTFTFRAIFNVFASVQNQCGWRLFNAKCGKASNSRSARLRQNLWKQFGWKVGSISVLRFGFKAVLAFYYCLLKKLSEYKKVE